MISALYVQGIAEPDVRWFWPEELLPVEERDDHSDSEDDTPDVSTALRWWGIHLSCKQCPLFELSSCVCVCVCVGCCTAGGVD